MANKKGEKKMFNTCIKAVQIQGRGIHIIGIRRMLCLLPYMQRALNHMAQFLYFMPDTASRS